MSAAPTAKRRMKNLPTAMQRFSAKVVLPDTPDGCWRWLGALRGGYGKITGHESYRDLPAHRFSYEQFVGPIPAGLVLDHLCRNPACVNPAHLEAVTERENILRGTGITARQARRTHCLRGHEFTPENTYRDLINGGRHCRKCKHATRTARDRRILAAKRAARNG